MQSQEMDRKLREAIERRMLVMFEYADLIRVVEPHRYGINSAGHPMLSGWLRAGYSRSDPEGGWRNYLLSEMHALQSLDAPFAGPRPGYAPHDARMREVFAELKGTPADAEVQGPYVVREPMTAALEPDAVPGSDSARTHDGEGEAPAESGFSKGREG